MTRSLHLRERTADRSLWLGRPDEALPPVSHEVDVQALLPALVVEIDAARGQSVDVVALLPALAVEIEAERDDNVPRGAHGGCGGSWRPAAVAAAAVLGSQRTARTAAGAAADGWRRAALAQASAVDAWRCTGTAAGAAADRWRDAAPVAGAVESAWRSAGRRAGAAADRWRDADRSAGAASDAWRCLRLRTAGLRSGWRDAAVLALALVDGWRLARVASAGGAIPWRDAGHPGTRRPGTVTPPTGPQPRPPIYGGGPLLLTCLRSRRTSTALWLGRPACGAAGPIVIPVRRAYLVLHVVRMTRVDGALEIPHAGCTIALSPGAHTWSVSATIAGRNARAALDPRAGEVLIDTEIDGWTWRWRVDRVTETEQFGTRGLRVEGRGLTVTLGAPYTLARSHVSTDPYSVAQLAALELPLGGGWTVDWQAADWLVPAGAWSYSQLTPIAALARLAESAGALLVPARDSRTIAVRPRYPAAPWEFASATPAVTIPAQALVSREFGFSEPSAVDAVYVIGAEGGGLLGHVRRTGYAGDTLAPQVLDPLMVHVDAIRARGLREIAAYYPSGPLSGFTLPLSSAAGDFPLLGIGDLIRVTDGSDAQTDVVTGLRVSVEKGERAWKVRQAVTLGESETALDRLLRLLPLDPLLAGQITADYGDGTRRVTLIGGGTLRARGDGAVGTMCYVRGQEIVGAAPALVGVEVEV